MESTLRQSRDTLSDVVLEYLRGAGHGTTMRNSLWEPFPGFFANFRGGEHSQNTLQEPQFP